MADLYGQDGLLNKAYESITQMPIEPNVIIWWTLLGACGILGAVQLAKKVKDRLAELDPNNSSDHVLLSNIYAVAGKWRDVAAVRRSMTDQRIKKEPGWSMIEVDKVMYNFVVGEGLNGATEEAHEKLVEIMSSIRIEGGYIPEVGSVLHDIEDEEKENAVSMHSENLAVAFGIARLCPGGLIRTIKNLRVCRDCHTVMNMIPKAYKREIVLKDKKFRIASTCSKMDLVLARITGKSYFVYRNDLNHGVTEVIDLLNDKFTSLFHKYAISLNYPTKCQT